MAAPLRLGSKGSEVRKLQLLLNAVPGVAQLSPDGQFGPGTLEAVTRFQRSKGLVADGIVGPRTWAALGQKGTAAAPTAVADPSAPWMEIAKAELGIHEDSLPGKQNARIIEYHKTTTLKATTDETPWCSSFVNWVMIQAQYKGTNNALARSWMEWGKGLPAPRPGAITVIKRKQAGHDVATGSSTGFHVAFFVSGDGASLRLLGGNQADSVKYSTFSLSGYDLMASRWPL